MSTPTLHGAAGAAPSSSAAPAAHPLRWWTLAVMVIAQFMFVVDAFIVNVALPSIRADLRATPAELEAVVAAYQIAYATLLITGGRLGDIVGRKFAFLTGLIGFTLGSLWCGVASSAGLLIAARIAQGGAAALMLPQVLASIQTLFPANERARAFSIFGLVLGLGGALGPVLGGLLIELDSMHLAWRSVFLVNLPVGIAATVAAGAVVPKFASKPGARLDLVGTALLGAGVVASLYPLVFGRDLGWPPRMLALLAAGGLGLVGFLRYESSVAARGGQPLFDVASLRDRAFATGLAASFAFYLGIASFLLVLTLYLQNGLHMSALYAGSTIVPLAAGFLFASRRATHWTERYGVDVLVAGVAVVILGLLWFLAVAHGLAASGSAHPVSAGAAFRRLAGPLACYGFGEGLVMAPLVSTVLARVRSAHAGALAGVFITVQQLSGASGIALIGAAFFSSLHGGFPHALSVSCAWIIGAALASMALLRRLAMLDRR
jgi:EmrB/QacA subfamily drug resistance transporter